LLSVPDVDRTLGQPFSWERRVYVIWTKIVLHVWPLSLFHRYRVISERMPGIMNYRSAITLHDFLRQYGHEIIQLDDIDSFVYARTWTTCLASFLAATWPGFEPAKCSSQVWRKEAYGHSQLRRRTTELNNWVELSFVVGVKWPLNISQSIAVNFNAKLHQHSWALTEMLLYKFHTVGLSYCILLHLQINSRINRERKCGPVAADRRVIVRRTADMPPRVIPCVLHVLPHATSKLPISFRKQICLRAGRCWSGLSGSGA